MPEYRNQAPDRRPPGSSGPAWIATGLAVAAVGYYLARSDPAPDAAPAAVATPARNQAPAMMNNTTRHTLACTAAATGSRILIAPYSRSFAQAGTYRCRLPVPPAPIVLSPGGSLDFEMGEGGRIAIRRPSAYPS